ncbi:MAG: radical SAM protein [Myxococcales bacterium]
MNLDFLPEDLKRSVRWKLHEGELALLRRAHPLRYLFVEVTRRCNLACSYCGSSCNGKEQRPEMTTAEWIGVMEQIAADFDATQVMVAVMGGEPTVKEGIFDFMAALQRLKFPWGMVTNGQTMDAGVAHRVVSLGMRSVSLSMDAPPELNDKLRGKGSSQKVIDAVGHLKAAGFNGKLEIMSTITAPAVEHLPEMRKLVAERKVPLWRVVPVMPIGRAAVNQELVPSHAQLRQIIEYVSEARKDGLMPAPEFCEEGFLGEQFEGQARTHLWYCLAGISIGGILCDGRVGACPELGDAFVQGEDVRRERFKDLWEQRYQVFRDRGWTDKGRCGSCDQFSRCQGGSLHLYHSPQNDPLRCLYLDAVKAPPPPPRR